MVVGVIILVVIVALLVLLQPLVLGPISGCRGRRPGPPPGSGHRRSVAGTKSDGSEAFNR
jgi:hypothetical protein